MTSVQKFVTQRLFGRTVIDSLDLNQNGWYIDEEQVTATAAELNAAGDGITTINAYNATGGAFAIGKLLHVIGYNAASGYLTVELADADNSKPAQYLAIDTTASGGTTIIQDYYDAVTFNTVGASAGDPVYLSAATPGAFSLAAPTGADDVVQIVGRVKLHNNAAGTVIIDLRKTEQVKIGTNEYVDGSVTDAKLADDVATGLAGTAASSALTATSGVLKVDIHSVTADTPASGDKLIFSDEGSAGTPNKTVTVDNYATFVAGVTADTGLSATSGVLKVDPADFAVSVGADSIVYMTAAGLPKKDSIADFATSFAGEGLVGAAGKVCLLDDGQTSHGGVFFTNPGDCDAITVGAVTYPRGVVQDVTIGRWIAGATAATSATSLADCINGDLRAPLVYTAEAIGDGVVIRALTPGVAGNVAVAKTGAAPAEPSTLQNLVEGRSAKTIKVGTVYHTVTTLDTKLASFTLELPFAPDTWIVQVRNSAGVIRNDLTDTFNFDGSPLGVIVTKTGITNVAAGDIITVISISL